ncbi:MAG: tRNA 2-thiocytidine biosynthesis protein TtcA [Firmicutes bacterium]|nr:tRNA 2-thiocytidine biosynthesis protein TtcA [Bacillota bacterium]
MIEAGDSVAVALSGGKDSGALLYILELFRRHAPFDFALQAIYVDLGWPVDPVLMQRYTESLQIPLYIEKTAIARIVFERRQETNPCALCAKLRRGALHQAALGLGANKVALGHHLDDAIETFLLNLIYTGDFNTFKPRTHLDRVGLYLIRPLIQLPGQTLASLARRENIPIIDNPCPVNNQTKRQEMAELVSELSFRFPDLRQKIRSAFLRSPLWPPE